MDAAALQVKFKRARALQDLSRYREARSAYLEVIALDPGHYRAWCNLSECHRMLKDFPEAARAAGEALRIRPDGVSALTELACCHWANGEIDLAESLLQDALRSNPRALFARKVLARLKFKSGHFAEANALIEQLEAECPNDAWVCMLRSDYHEQKMQHAQANSASEEAGREMQCAIDAARRALGLDPENLLAMERLGELYLKSDRALAALEQLENYIERSPENESVQKMLVTAVHRTHRLRHAFGNQVVQGATVFGDDDQWSPRELERRLGNRAKYISWAILLTSMALVTLLLVKFHKHELRKDFDRAEWFGNLSEEKQADFTKLLNDLVTETRKSNRRSRRDTTDRSTTEEAVAEMLQKHHASQLRLDGSAWLTSLGLGALFGIFLALQIMLAVDHIQMVRRLNRYQLTVYTVTPIEMAWSGYACLYLAIALTCIAIVLFGDIPLFTEAAMLIPFVYLVPAIPSAVVATRVRQSKLAFLTPLLCAIAGLGIGIAVTAGPSETFFVRQTMPVLGVTGTAVILLFGFVAASDP